MDSIETVCIITSCISLIIAAISCWYTFKTKRRYEKLVTRLGNGEKITDILEKYINQVNELDKKDDQIIEYYNKINTELGLCIRKVGLIRYDLYNNTKHKLSFALALLDRENNGIVLNSVYGANDSNIYAKEIIKGTSKYELSSEEKDAVEKAKKNR